MRLRSQHISKPGAVKSMSIMFPCTVWAIRQHSGSDSAANEYTSEIRLRPSVTIHCVFLSSPFSLLLEYYSIPTMNERVSNDKSYAIHISTPEMGYTNAAYLAQTEDLTHLIIVCCHAIWLGGPTNGYDETEWCVFCFFSPERFFFLSFCIKSFLTEVCFLV